MKEGVLCAMEVKITKGKRTSRKGKCEDRRYMNMVHWIEGEIGPYCDPIIIYTMEYGTIDRYKEGKTPADV